MTKELTIALVGSGGDGVVTAGDLIAHVAAAEGLHAIRTEAYGPQIRGGESSCTVRVSSQPISNQGDLVDLLVVFRWSDLARFRHEILLAADALVLHEETDPVPEDFDFDRSQIRAVPFRQMARETGSAAGANMVMLGVIAELTGLPLERLTRAVRQRFARKSAAVAETNALALKAGAEWCSRVLELTSKKLDYVPSPSRPLLSGNEATALAALHAGCRFFAGYPITPSTEILQFASEWMPRLGGTVVQTEDELSAIGAVIGASFAGVKSMTATSGPGLSLMSEMMGLATMAEIPAVIVNVQRTGPSTGIPTKGEQSDLWHALFAGHGDSPRVVLGTTDVEDCFHTTVEAFNIAEEFQIPVVVLSDQTVAQRSETLTAVRLEHEVHDRRQPQTDELNPYQRYRHSPDGVSPMSIPGTPGGMYQTNGLEHDELGRPNATFVTHAEMNAKRFRKLWPIRERYRFVRYIGPERADIGVVCWGSSKGAVEEAVNRANDGGLRVSAFIPRVLFPFPKDEFEMFAGSVDRILVVELSYSAQFYKYLRTFLDLPRERVSVFKRSGGKPLATAEVEQELIRLFTEKRRSARADVAGVIA